MNNDKVIGKMLARIQALEEKVAELSKQISGEEVKEDSGNKEKRCLPGYNHCIIEQKIRQ